MPKTTSRIKNVLITSFQITIIITASHNQVWRKFGKEILMEILNKIKAWASALADLGVSLLALGIVLEVLFKGQSIPFLSQTNIIGNITQIVKTFSTEGLVGLVAIFILYSIYKKK